MRSVVRSAKRAKRGHAPITPGPILHERCRSRAILKRSNECMSTVTRKLLRNLRVSLFDYVVQVADDFAVTNRSRRLESAKNVGAHKPTNIPNRSPWAISGSFAKYQMAMDAKTETKPATKQMLLSMRDKVAGIGYLHGGLSSKVPRMFVNDCGTSSVSNISDFSFLSPLFSWDIKWYIISVIYFPPQIPERFAGVHYLPFV